MTNDEYKKRGRNALAYFHNKALNYPDYKLTLDELVDLLDSRSRNFTEGLGLGIVMSEAPERNVKAGMETLAVNGKGKIPATNASFTQAIANNVASNISYVDALTFTATESAKQLGEGISEGLEVVGTSVIQGLKVGKYLTEYWYLTIPAVIVGYIAINQFIKARVR